MNTIDSLSGWIEELRRRRDTNGRAVVTLAEATQLRDAIGRNAGGLQVYEDLSAWLRGPGDEHAVVVVPMHADAQRLRGLLGQASTVGPMTLRGPGGRRATVVWETSGGRALVGARFDAAFLFTDGPVAAEARRRVRQPASEDGTAFLGTLCGVDVYVAAQPASQKYRIQNPDGTWTEGEWA